MMLGSSEAGRSWLADLATFLERYGHRGNHWGLQHPTWIEDPTETFATHAAEREAAVIEVHARLQGFPAPAAARRVNKGDILSHCAVVARDIGFQPSSASRMHETESPMGNGAR
jgi:hypothetical protein